LLVTIYPCFLRVAAVLPPTPAFLNKRVRQASKNLSNPTFYTANMTVITIICAVGTLINFSNIGTERSAGIVNNNAHIIIDLITFILPMQGRIVSYAPGAISPQAFL
jgi:ABC-type spermidine/putrescine transport system permease subunit II